MVSVMGYTPCFQSKSLGLVLVAALPSSSTTVHPGQEIWDVEQGQMLPSPALWALCGCLARYLRACAVSLQVTEASAQAGQTFGWLHFVSRNDLRDALA